MYCWSEPPFFSPSLPWTSFLSLSLLSLSLLFFFLRRVSPTYIWTICNCLKLLFTLKNLANQVLYIKKKKKNQSCFCWGYRGSRPLTFIPFISVGPTVVATRSPGHRETHLKTLRLVKWVINWNSEDSSFSFSANIKFACVTDRVNCFICKTKV